MILSAQSIRLRCVNASRPMVSPFAERTRFEGVTYGLGPAGYDVRIAQDITIAPRAFALGSTVERFDVPTNVLFSIRDKSTWARRGVSVFNSTGEPGWRGFLTIELVNHGPETVELRAGMGIAHVVFERLDQPTDQPYEGKYQDQREGPQAAIAEVLPIRAKPIPIIGISEPIVAAGLDLPALDLRTAPAGNVDLKPLVEEALRNAKDNGVDFAGWTAEAIAEDMVRCDFALEDADPVAVAAVVRELRGVGA